MDDERPPVQPDDQASPERVASPDDDRRRPVRPFEDTLKKAAAARLDTARSYGTLGTVGLSFVIALVIGTGAGLWLDRVTGWSPAFFLTGFGLGLAAGVLNVYRAMSNLPK
jgi:ATP synthase protein I